MAGLPDTASCYLWVVWALDCQAAEAKLEQYYRDQARKKQAEAQRRRARR